MDDENRANTTGSCIPERPDGEEWAPSTVTAGEAGRPQTRTSCARAHAVMYVLSTGAMALPPGWLPRAPSIGTATGHDGVWTLHDALYECRAQADARPARPPPHDSQSVRSAERGRDRPHGRRGKKIRAERHLLVDTQGAEQAPFTAAVQDATVARPLDAADPDLETVPTAPIKARSAAQSAISSRVQSRSSSDRSRKARPVPERWTSSERSPGSTVVGDWPRTGDLNLTALMSSSPPPPMLRALSLLSN